MFVVSSYLAWCFLSVKTYVNTEGKMKSMKSYRVDPEELSQEAKP